MADLQTFLEDLGLTQLVEVFRSNDIDADALLHLEEFHLKELGLSLGHRVKLTRAIAALRAAEGLPKVGAASSAALPEGVASRQTTAADEGERRQLTLMFCDFVGSTELSARADPEEVREVMRAYQDTCAGMIARYDGYLAKFLGDGVLAYFGYPHAHEDAAERAVRAARGIVEAAARQPAHAGHRLAVRIGIATGLVVVGQVVSADGASELSAIGETPNLAARLQALAEPNSVVIADSTRALTRGAFRYTDLGMKRLKGLPAPIRVWEVMGDAEANRFEAAHASGLSSFFGRDQEVALLQARWDQAAAGEGQAVLLCGEGGIGKSRIAEQLRQRLRDVPHTSIRHQCSPFHVNSALQPVIAQLEFAAGIAGDDSGTIRLDKLEALLRPTTSNLAETLPLLASLLGIPLDQRYAPLRVTADLARRRTLEALAEQLVALSASKPVFWLVEDAHWVDPSTRELIGICLDRIREARIFVLITFRPEFAPPWAQMPHATTLALNRLSRRQCAGLVNDLCAGNELPGEILEQIVAKTDGIPLFIEELTKTVLESGLLKERDGRYVLTGPLPPMAIPASLQDSLMARLDRLSLVREVAQIGSVIGREFSYDLLAAVAPMGANELCDALSQLAKAELVFIRGTPPDATYVFKHALVQDAAYASLLRGRRQQLHARVAEALQEKVPETGTRRPELLAHHYAAAGMDQRAKELWIQAGRQAFTRYDFAEALNDVGKALVLVRREPDTGTRLRTEAELLDDQAVLLAALRGPGSPETGRAAEEAVKVSAPLGDDALHVRALWMDWMQYTSAGRISDARARAEHLVEIADRVGDIGLKLQAHHARWTTAFLSGQVRVARADIEQGLELYDFEQHKGHWALFGAHDPGVCARGTGACTMWLAGEAVRGARVAEDAVRISQELQHPFSQGIALLYAGFYAVMARDPESAATRAAACARVAAEAKLALPAAMAKIIGGWATARGTDLGRGADQMEATYREWLNAKQRVYSTFIAALIAEAKLDMGRVEEALVFLDEAEQVAADSHQCMFLPDLHRLRAEALCRVDARHPRIESEFRTAVELAREQGALALELRAATGMAKWMSETGRHAESLKLLRPVYCRFTEGHDTPDLKAARAIISSLA